MSIRYLLDENLPPSWRKRLLRRGPDLVVRRVGEAGTPPLESSDAQLLAWCEVEGFMLVTNNRRSMPGHLSDYLAQGRHVPGVVITTAGMTASQVFEELVLMAGASFESEYEDQILYLPLARP